MAKPSKQLTSEDLDRLNKLIRSCEETDRMCKDCEECLLDVDPEKRQNTEQLTIARKLKAKFFPTAT